MNKSLFPMLVIRYAIVVEIFRSEREKINFFGFVVLRVERATIRMLTMRL